tara:strand:- start:49 stop:249 length:201 start_codon:yes stop_codon:yes gene_type:complete
MKTIKLTNAQYEELLEKADSYDDWCWLDEQIDYVTELGDLKEKKKLMAKRKLWEEMVNKIKEARIN